MKIKVKKLENLMLEVALIKLQASNFRRRDMLLAAESQLRNRDLWLNEDDLPFK